MTSQQAVAILAAAGIGAPTPGVHTKTDAEYVWAITLLEAAGYVVDEEVVDQEYSEGYYTCVKFLTSDGWLTVFAPTRTERDEPIHSLVGRVLDAAGTDRLGEVVGTLPPSRARELADAFMDDDRVDITAKGRRHLSVFPGGEGA